MLDCLDEGFRDVLGRPILTGCELLLQESQSMPAARVPQQSTPLFRLQVPLTQ